MAAGRGLVRGRRSRASRTSGSSNAEVPIPNVSPTRLPPLVLFNSGISTIEPETEDVLRALSASKADIIMKVGVPRAMPYLFGSLKVAITSADVGSVIGEQNASNVGIGNLLTRASAAFEARLVWLPWSCSPSRAS